MKMTIDSNMVWQRYPVDDGLSVRLRSVAFGAIPHPPLESTENSIGATSLAETEHSGRPLLFLFAPAMPAAGSPHINLCW